MKTKQVFFTGLLLFLLSGKYLVIAQVRDFTVVRGYVNFSDKLREWDGFGFNYVELAHTYDYDEFKQEYGGFSLLEENEKQDIVQLVFGEDGLKVGLVKMFLDPLHQKKPGGEFDHKTTTENMRYFVREGLKLTRKCRRDLQIITTLYGPPGWATIQNEPRGRDLNPECKKDVANYMISWAQFLIEEEGFPVKYISLHNEGEDWHRWNEQGHTTWPGHDYNLYWPSTQVVDFLEFMPKMLQDAGLNGVSVTNGEPSNWYRFSTWGFVDALLKSEEALSNLKLITSHGFYSGNYGVWFGEHKSEGIDRIRKVKPEIHAWVTSTSWSKMDTKNIKEMHGNIYTTKVNGIIPWAGIQRPKHWVKGDPNPGCAIYVHEDGSYEVRRGYYFYKQISRAGQPGMAVTRTWQEDSEIAIIAFSNNGTSNSDAFIVVNLSDQDNKTVVINLQGTEAKVFEAFQTTEDMTMTHSYIGDFKVKEGMITNEVPAGSVTTFYAK